MFYLGELFREVPIETDIPKFKNTKLGDLWNAYENGQLSKLNMNKAEEIFEAISVRIPQDAMSGAQVLHFRGFTGIKDHGILQHGRVLRAEGGADLDGDESSIFFGGKSESGDGYGMKNSHKEMFRKQKDEYKMPNGELANVKEMFKDELHIDGHSEDINVNELADAHDQLSRALHWILDETDVEYITGGRATQKAEADSQPEQFTPMEFPHDES